jgi:hypothetical protein
MLLMLGPPSTNYCLELGSNSLYSGGARVGLNPDDSSCYILAMVYM